MKNLSYTELQLKALSAEAKMIVKRRAIVQRCITLKEKNSKELVLLGGFLTGFLIAGPILFKKKGRSIGRSYLLKRLVFSMLTIMNLSNYIRPVFRHFFKENPAEKNPIKKPPVIKDPPPQKIPDEDPVPPIDPPRKDPPIQEPPIDNSRLKS